MFSFFTGLRLAFVKTQRLYDGFIPFVNVFVLICKDIWGFSFTVVTFMMISIIHGGMEISNKCVIVCKIDLRRTILVARTT